MDWRLRGPERDLEGWRSFLSWREEREMAGREKRVNSLYFASWDCWEMETRSWAGLCNQSRGVSLSLHTVREHTPVLSPDTNSFLPTESVNTSPPSCPLHNISCYQHFHSHRLPDNSKGTICTFDARQVSCWDFHFNENYFDFSSFSEKLGVTSYRSYRWYVKLTGELCSWTVLWREIMKSYETSVDEMSWIF